MRLNRKWWGRVAPGLFLGALLFGVAATTVTVGWGFAHVVKRSIAAIGALHGAWGA